MNSSKFLLLLWLALTCVAVYGQDSDDDSEPISGAPENKSTEMTPEMQKLIDSGLKQMTELGGEFAIEDPIKTVVLKYTTQVVSGLLHEILLELRYSTGSKLRACVYDATSSNIIPSTCSTAEECQTLLDTHGKCWTRPV